MSTKIGKEIQNFGRVKMLNSGTLTPHACNMNMGVLRGKQGGPLSSHLDFANML